MWYLPYLTLPDITYQSSNAHSSCCVPRQVVMFDDKLRLQPTKSCTKLLNNKNKERKKEMNTEIFEYLLFNSPI